MRLLFNQNNDPFPQDDFDSFMWTIVFLAMGGIALGKGVVSSGLLNVMDLIIRDLVNGFSLYSVILILSPVVLVSTIVHKSSYAHSFLFLRSFPPSSVTQ